MSQKHHETRVVIAIRPLLARAWDYIGNESLGPLLIRSVAGTGLVHIATMLATFAVGILLARGLGVQGYGQYGIAMAILTIAGMPTEIGLSRLVTRETAAAGARKDWPTFFGVLHWAISTGLGISLLVMMLVVAGALLLGGSMNSDLATAILWGVPVVPLTALAAIRAGVLMALNKTVLSQASTTLLRPVLLSLLLMSLLLLNDRLRPQDAMALNTITAAAALVATYLLVRKFAPARTPELQTADHRQWLAATIPLALTGAIVTLQGQLTILILGLVASSSEVGLFRVAASISAVLAAPMTVVSIVALPLISRLHAEGDRRRLQKLMTHSAQAQLAGMLALALPLLAAGEPIIGILFGDEFAPATGPLRLLLIAQIVSAGLGLNAGLLNMTGHERRVTRALAIGLSLNLIVVVALAPAVGIYGAVAGYVISMIAWNLLAWRDARRLEGIDTSFVGAHVGDFA